LTNRKDETQPKPTNLSGAKGTVQLPLTTPYPISWGVVSDYKNKTIFPLSLISQRSQFQTYIISCWGWPGLEIIWQYLWSGYFRDYFLQSWILRRLLPVKSYSWKL